MIDIIGDPAFYILQYLDFDSLVAATKVSITWHDEIMQHRQIFIQHYIENCLNSRWSECYGFEDTSISSEDLMSLTTVTIKAKNSNCTPLYWASRNGLDKVVKLLIDKGAQLEARDNANCTALYWASRNGHDKVVRLLIDNGADLAIL